MAAAECAVVKGYQPSLLDSPNCEIAHITIANTGDYYSSRKFRKVTHVLAQLNYTATSPFDEFISAHPDTTDPNRVTLVVAGSDTTAVKATLWIFGEP